MIKIKLLVIFAILILTASAFSQPLVLDVSYTRWENDLNKSTVTETYQIVNSSMMYAIDYGGKSMPNEIDEKKECSLGQVAYDRLVKAVHDNKINRDEYIYQKERADDKLIFLVKIIINLVFDGTAYTIHIEGEPNLVMDSKTYLEVIVFIKELRAINRDC